MTTVVGSPNPSGYGQAVSFTATVVPNPDGGSVQAGEPLFQLETDKASSVVPAPGSGVLKIGVAEGETVAIGATIGGRTNWRSGNGNDSLQLGSGSNNYNVNVQFGNSDDSFTLATTGLVSGRADGGGRLSSNVFTQNGAILSPYFQLSNFV